MAITTVKATGLTCEHCGLSVREEVGEIPGVSDVAVQVKNGGTSTITITHAGDLNAQAVADAITEAGFTLVV